MTDAPVSPLRRRMIEDMTIRKLAPRTQQGYIRAVKNFRVFFGASPDKASFEDVRRYQLHLVERGTSVPIINQALTRISHGRSVHRGSESAKVVLRRTT